MKKFLIIGLVASCLKIAAQVAQPSQRTCGTGILPQQFETWVQNLNINPTGKYSASSIQSVFYIPVIVHIIHNNEALNGPTATSGGNLNAAQVLDQINILNKDYNGVNTDTTLIPNVFKPLLGKFKVNFCLAVVNPTGGILAEPGIDRLNRVTKGWTAPPYSQTYIDANIKPNTIWDPNRYLNIWVSGLSNGLLGYATFPNPGSSGISGLGAPFGSATSDGVVILNTSFGSIGTAATGIYNKGRTATHEIGHWMGLRHIWGDGNCANDYCGDTPPAQNANYNCPNFPYKLGTCSGNTTGEMTMNYMDYTNDACMYMFTADQKNRAQLILTNSTMRAALITSTVCNLPTVGNDVGISFVSKPTYFQPINCLNFIDPIINVTNYGSTALTSALFTFNVDGLNTQTLSWTGSAAPNTSFTVALTQISGLTFGSHTFSVNVSSPNGGADNNLSNNNNLQNFSITSNLIITASSGTTCLGTPIVLSAFGATSFSWSTGGSGASISVNPLVTSVYVVTGTTGICTAQKTLTVTVVTTPTITLDKTSVCSGVPTQITASGAGNYQWDTGETTAGVSVTLFATTNVTVTGNSGAGCISSQAFTISINPLPALTTSATNAGCGSCNDATVSATPSGGTPPYSYTWSPTNTNSQVLANIGVGCYTVNISDALGCMAVDSACVAFDTGILKQTANEAGIKVMPNPTSGKFVIEFKTSGNKQIEITDISGRLIKTSLSVSNSASIDITAFEEGIYYVKIISSENKFTVLKVVKK